MTVAVQAVGAFVVAVRDSIARVIGRRPDLVSAVNGPITVASAVYEGDVARRLGNGRVGASVKPLVVDVAAIAMRSAWADENLTVLHIRGNFASPVNALWLPAAVRAVPVHNRPSLIIVLDVHGKGKAELLEIA